MFLILLSTVFNSCRKEILTTSLKPKPISNINLDVVSYSDFLKNVNLNSLGFLKAKLNTSNSTYKLLSIADDNSFGNLAIYADSIQKFTTKEGISYVFKMALSSPRAISFRNLTVFVSSEGNTSAFIATYTPTQQWINAYKINQKISFKGEVSFAPLSLSSQTLTQSLSYSANNSDSNEKVMSIRNKKMVVSNICYSYTIFQPIPMLCSAGDHLPGQNCPYSNGQVALGNYPPYYDYGFVTHTDCFEVDLDAERGTGGTGTPPTNGGGSIPSPPNPYLPCNGEAPVSSTPSHQGLKLAVLPPAPCDPGDTGGLYPLPPQPARKILLDATVVNNPKINCLLKKLLGLDGTAGNAQMKALLAAFVGKGFDVTFKIGTTKDPNSKGETSPDPNDPTKYNIILNQTKINDESQMSWVKTLLHEAFHANLMQKSYEMFGDYAVGLWPIGPKDLSLEELMNKIESLLQPQPTLAQQHHEFMAMNIESIKNGLKSFYSANNVAINDFIDYHFLSLAYEGLHQTSYYNDKVIKNPDGSEKIVDFVGTPTPLDAICKNLYKVVERDTNIPCN